MNDSPTPEHATTPESPGCFLRHFRMSWFLWAVVGFVVFTRFYNVSLKPLHHDESLFAYYSHFLSKLNGYDYQPILHGPVLQNLNALFFLLFGDSKLTMRLPAILGGIAIFLVTWFWKKDLGRVGTAAAMVMLALSPSITYYSRFLRNDVPYLAVTMWCALCVVRAYQTGKRVYFGWGIIAATIMFSMMESSIFFFAACIGFLVVAVVSDWIAGAWNKHNRPAAEEAAPTVSEWSSANGIMLSWCVAFVITVVLGWLFHRVFADTIPLYAPLVNTARVLGLDLSPHTANIIIACATMPVMFVLCLVCAANYEHPHGATGTLHQFLRISWKNRWTIIMASSIGLIIFTVLFTTYFTTYLANNGKVKDFAGNDVLMTPVQIYKNTWDYWWDQHKLHRIKGPFHYYLPIIFLYELPVVCIVLIGWIRDLLPQRKRSGRRTFNHFAAYVLIQAIALVLYKLGVHIAHQRGYSLDWGYIDRKFHLTGPGHFYLILSYVQLLTYLTGLLFVRGLRVEAFLVFWTVTSLFAYSYAGEKVPWLTVHTVGPLCLLAGLYIGRWSESFRRWGPVLRWSAVTLICLAGLYQFRTQVLLNFVHPWSPAERLVYNHTSPDIEYALRRIDDVAQRTYLGNQLPLFVRGEMEWPLYWYLRDWPNATPPTDETPEETTRPVVLVNWESSNIDNLEKNYTIERLKIREWWEPPLLNPVTMLDLYLAMTPLESRSSTSSDGTRRLNVNGNRYEAAVAEWRKLLRYLAYREIWLDINDPIFSNSANEFALCIRKDLQQQYRERPILGRLPMRRDIPLTGY